MSIDSLDARALWPYNNDDWDELWERDTEFDDLYLQFGNSSFTTPDNAGGTHTHVDSPGHTHTSSSHRHTISAGLAAGTVGVGIDDPGGMPAYVCCAEVHSHTSVNGAYTAVSFDTQYITGASSETAAVPYLRVVVLKPKKVAADIPINSMAFGDTSTKPHGFDKVSGSYEELFLRGAETGLYGGGTSSDDTHDHTTSDSHDHAPVNHTHGSVLCGYGGSVGCLNSGATRAVRPLQHHNVSLSSKAIGDTDTTVATILEASFTPEFIKLLGLYNSGSRPRTPVGICIGFVNSVANIPANWSVVGAAYDLQPRMTLVDGDVGNTGGDNDHGHTADHGHTWTSNHNHTTRPRFTTGDVHPDAGVTQALDMVSFPVDNHTHSWTVGDASPTCNDAEVTLDDADGRPPYRTLLLIKKDSLNRKDVSNGTIYGTEDVALAA